MVNIPLAAGAGSDEFRAAVRDHWLPALDRHRPQILYVSAGFDAHREDPLAGLQFTEADYAWVTRELVAVAARHAQGRIVSTLEGGYALSALGRSAAEHIRELIARVIVAASPPRHDRRGEPDGNWDLRRRRGTAEVSRILRGDVRYRGPCRDAGLGGDSAPAL